MNNRVAMVTGAAQGIGKGIAAALATEEFRVAVADLNLTAAEQTAKEITAAGGVAIAVEIDVTRTASVESAVRAVEAALGPVEVVVNNAGWDDFMPFVQTTEEFWDKILDINFKGALRVIKTVVPGMMGRGFGRVINIGSDAGRVGSSLEAVYSGAKGGIIAFTKTLAREVAAKGVTANTVCPGPTDTPALRSFAEGSGDAEKVIAGMVRAVPMKRLGAPEDIDELKQQNALLEQHLADLRLQLDERDQDLAAARSANRELMAQLFVGVPEDERAAMVGGTLGDLLGFKAPLAATSSPN